MNVTSKLDLDGMLNDWPAPALDEAAWETRADRIVEVAMSRRAEETAALADLLAVPDLAAEPGEEQAADVSREANAAGEHGIMAHGSGASGVATSEASPPGGGAARPPEKKRQSLKEIAERASQSSARANGAAASALSTPLPSSGRSALSTPLPPSGRVSTAPGRGSIPGGGRTSSPSLRPAETVTEDSGVIDLNRLSASIPPEHVEQADRAQPSAADALEAERPAEVAAVSARRPRTTPSAAAAEVPAKKRSGGVIAGAAIAALGLAAAVAVMVQTSRAPQQTETAAAPNAATPAVGTTPAAPTNKAPAEPASPPAAPTVAAADEQAAQQPAVAAEQPAAPTEKVVVAPKAAAAPGGAGAPAPAVSQVTPAPATAAKEDDGKLAAVPSASAKPGDLPSAMQAAVGVDGEKPSSVVTEAPVPASGPLGQQNVPEQPSQGSVQAALGSVMGGARACVAGADDMTRAQITFSSAGAVTKVVVSGWAAANGQSSCVQAALKGANVGPFSKPSYAVSATIRP